MAVAAYELMRGSAIKPKAVIAPELRFADAHADDAAVRRSQSPCTLPEREGSSYFKLYII